MKIEIKNRYSGEIIFSHEQENNSIKITLEKAISARADLGYANLRNADLRGADLRGVNLRGVNLIGADLCSADLRGADLCSADLRNADLIGADLCSADLRGADLRGADLRGADLHDADLGGAKDVPYIPIACPSDGAFVGWKKINNYLVKLEIPEDAKRCSATTNKCRCDKAKVLDIYNLDGSDAKVPQVTNGRYTSVTYKVGEMVYPDSFDEDRWDECSHGIHFFINKQEAIDYA